MSGKGLPLCPRQAEGIPPGARRALRTLQTPVPADTDGAERGERLEGRAVQVELASNRLGLVLQLRAVHLAVIALARLVPLTPIPHDLPNLKNIGSTL